MGLTYLHQLYKLLQRLLVIMCTVRDLPATLPACSAKQAKQQSVVATLPGWLAPKRHPMNTTSLSLSL